MGWAGMRMQQHGGWPVCRETSGLCHCTASAASWHAPSPPPRPAGPPPANAGMAPLLEDAAATLTIFAPVDAAWSAVDASAVDLGDRETLQAVLSFLVTQARRGWRMLAGLRRWLRLLSSGCMAGRCWDEAAEAAGRGRCPD